MVTPGELLAKLPPYRDEWVMIKENQEVKRDIIPELLNGYIEFEKYYDDIALLFVGETVADTCDNLFDFCKKYITYNEETVEWQTSALPAGILTRGYADCKGYASFIGGCLGAINRQTGAGIDWHFCFASYKLFQRTPYHVFIVVDTEEGPVWVDPTPGAEGKIPIWEVNRKTSDTMALVRNVAGVGVGDTTPPADNTGKYLLIGAGVLLLWLMLKED